MKAEPNFPSHAEVINIIKTTIPVLTTDLDFFASGDDEPMFYILNGDLTITFSADEPNIIWVEIPGEYAPKSKKYNIN